MFLILFFVPLAISSLTGGSTHAWWHSAAVTVLSEFPYLAVLLVYALIVGIIVAIRRQ